MNTIERGDRALNAFICFFLVIIGFVAIYPLYFVIISSISNPAYISRGEVLVLPKGLNVQAYIALFNDARIWRGYLNSLFYTAGNTLLNLAVTLPCAYALSRPTLPGRKALFIFFILTQYFRGGTVPTYLLMADMKLLNTIWIMLLPHGITTFNLIIAKNYFEGNIPESMYESARIDGSSNTRFFISFVLPLSKPITAVLALFFAISKWNSYFEPMLYIQDTKIQSLQVIIRSITANLDSSVVESLDPGAVSIIMQRQQLMKYAVVVVSVIPLMLLYPFIQRYFITGIMVGSVKE